MGALLSGSSPPLPPFNFPLSFLLSPLLAPFSPFSSLVLSSPLSSLYSLLSHLSSPFYTLSSPFSFLFSPLSFVPSYSLPLLSTFSFSSPLCTPLLLSPSQASSLITQVPPLTNWYDQVLGKSNGLFKPKIQWEMFPSRENTWA